MITKITSKPRPNKVRLLRFISAHRASLDGRTIKVNKPQPRPDAGGGSRGGGSHGSSRGGSIGGSRPGGSASGISARSDRSTAQSRQAAIKYDRVTGERIVDDARRR